MTLVVSCYHHQYFYVQFGTRPQWTDDGETLAVVFFVTYVVHDVQVGTRPRWTDDGETFVMVFIWPTQSGVDKSLAWVKQNSCPYYQFINCVIIFSCNVSGEHRSGDVCQEFGDFLLSLQTQCAKSNTLTGADKDCNYTVIASPGIYIHINFP